jgi:hypothetical protein
MLKIAMDYLPQQETRHVSWAEKLKGVLEMTANLKLRPLRDLVLVEPVKDPDRVGKLVVMIAHSSRPDVFFGLVKGVGPQCMEAKEGDTVVIPRSIEVIDAGSYLIPEKDLIGIVC